MMRNLYLYIYIIIASLLIFSVGFPANGKDKSLGLKTVVIDAGHGGKDPGCISKDRKTQEKNVVLDICKRFGKKINEVYPDVKVVYTRSSDVYVTLNDRAGIANRNDADLFISIHINANDSPSVHGASVHILGQSRDRTYIPDHFLRGQDRRRKVTGKKFPLLRQSLPSSCCWPL